MDGWVRQFIKQSNADETTSHNGTVVRFNPGPHLILRHEDQRGSQAQTPLESGKSRDPRNVMLRADYLQAGETARQSYGKGRPC